MQRPQHRVFGIGGCAADAGKKSYSETYGARNLRRTIQRELEDPIAEKIIDSFEAPISTITVHAEHGEVSVQAE